MAVTSGTTQRSASDAYESTDYKYHDGMGAREDAVRFWDEELARWTSGDLEMSPEARRWFISYSGKGDGATDLSVFPEPYIGPLAGSGAPALVMLGLNPGPPAPEFQGANGIFTRQIAQTSYRQWAGSGAYTSLAWESANGRNKYHRDRLSFARRFVMDDATQPEDLLYLELYPFHSKRVTAPIRPPRDVLDRFLLDPLAEIDVEFVFAFGKPWHAAAETLGLGSGLKVWAKWSTPSREARTYRLPSGQSLVVMSQGGYAGPPGESDTSALRAALIG